MDCSKSCLSAFEEKEMRLGLPINLSLIQCPPHCRLLLRPQRFIIFSSHAPLCKLDLASMKLLIACARTSSFEFPNRREAALASKLFKIQPWDNLSQ